MKTTIITLILLLCGASWAQEIAKENTGKLLFHWDLSKAPADGKTFPASQGQFSAKLNKAAKNEKGAMCTVVRAVATVRWWQRASPKEAFTSPSLSPQPLAT